MKKITYTTGDVTLTRLGNWAGPKDLFPEIVIDQATRHAIISYAEISDSNRGMWGKTHTHTEELSADGSILRISGECGLRNDRRRCGGRQKFCYIVFVGDSDHIYVHRSVASKGWLESPVADLRKRLVKLGIGATSGVIQQGDYLLKPANGSAREATEFLHETTGSGHHRFAAPVLYCDPPGGGSRQYLISEPMLLRHEAIDGIQHPDQIVPAGIWIVGSTSASLRHGAMRD